MGRKPDHYLRVIAVRGGTRIPNIPCKIYLAPDAAHKSRVVLLPDRATAQTLMAGNGPWTLLGRPKPFSGSHLRVHDFFVSNSPTTTWSDGIEETRVFGRPRAIVVASPLHPSARRRTSVIASLHGGKLVRPALISEHLFKGSVVVRRSWLCRVRLSRTTLIAFDQFAENRRGSPSFLQLGMQTYLPGRIGRPEMRMRDYGQTLEDIMTLVSIAGRERTTWHRLTASDGQAFVTYYDTSRPLPARTQTYHDPLVEKDDVPAFLKRAFPRLAGGMLRTELVAASFSLAPYRRLPLESAFMHAFACLEALVVRLDGGTNAATVLPERSWQRLRKEIQRTIKKWNGGHLSEVERKAMYSKLQEVNRPPFRHAWESCIVGRRIPIGDLWPMSAPDDLLDLLEIRNRLAHGRLPPEGAAGGLHEALLHLELLLERLVLSSFSYPLRGTNADPGRLWAKAIVSAHQLRKRREQMTAFWPR